MVRKIMNSLYNKITLHFYKLKYDQNGIGSIEMVLLILVLLGVIVLFRDYIQALIQAIFQKITKQINAF